jgi:hypothetical protein
VVFDRDLALIWEHRLTELIAAGLLTPADRFIYQAQRQTDPEVTFAALSRLCHDEDGPRWVVAPVKRMQTSVLNAATALWQAPATEYQLPAKGVEPFGARDYAIFSCAVFRTTAA